MEIFIGTLNEPEILQLNFLNDNNINFNKEQKYIPYFYKTPSELEGLSEIKEKKLRLFCSLLIQDAGIHLKLPQLTVLTALSIFHHFYYRKSFIIFEPFHISVACLLIAVKSEESQRRTRDIISVFCYILKKKEIYENINVNETGKPVIPLLELPSEKYDTIKKNLLSLELHILKEIGFCLYNLSNHPHKYLLHFIKLLNGNKLIVQKAWNYINDTYKSTLIVNYAPNKIAISAVYLSFKALRFEMPKFKEWSLIFGCSLEEIEEIACLILKIYDIGKVKLNDVREIIKPYNKKQEEQIENTKKCENDKTKKFHKQKRNEEYTKRRKRSYSESSRSSYTSDKYKSRKNNKYKRSRSKEIKHKSNKKSKKRNKRENRRSRSRNKDSKNSFYSNSSSS